MNSWRWWLYLADRARWDRRRRADERRSTPGEDRELIQGVLYSFPRLTADEVATRLGYPDDAPAELCELLYIMVNEGSIRSELRAVRPCVFIGSREPLFDRVYALAVDADEVRRMVLVGVDPGRQPGFNTDDVDEVPVGTD